jgi:type I restriction enzyme S subunit
MQMTATTVGDIITADEPGFACSKTKLVDNGLIHLRPFNIDLDGKISLTELYQVPPDEALAGRAKLEAGDILFNNTNSAELVGKAALVSEPMEAGFSNHINRIRVNQSKVDPRWFALWIRKKRETGFFTRNATRWVSQAAFKSSELRRLPINVPPLVEQRRVADLLSRAESIVRMRREAEQKAKEIIPALFLDMFGDPATNPKGWIFRTIGEVADIQGGLQVTTKRASLPLEVPYLRVANVHRTHLDLSEIKLIRATEAELNRTRLLPGDLLVIEGHGNPAEIGRVGIWPGGIDPCVHQNHLIRVRCMPERFHPVYVWAYLNSADGRRFLLREGKTTSGLNTISVSNVKGVSVPQPPIELQKRFADRIAEVTALQGSQQMASIRANHAFQSLMAGVFGEGA